MTKRGFKRRLAKLTGLTESQVGKMLDAITMVVLDAMIREDRVTWTGLGSFHSKLVKPRSVRPPGQTMSVQIPAHLQARFKPSKSLKDALHKASQSPVVLARIAEMMGEKELITSKDVDKMVTDEQEKVADALVSDAFSRDAEVIKAKPPRVVETPNLEDLEEKAEIRPAGEPADEEAVMEAEPVGEEGAPAVLESAREELSAPAPSVAEEIKPATEAGIEPEEISPEEAAQLFASGQAESSTAAAEEDNQLSGVKELLGVDEALLKDTFKILEDERKKEELEKEKMSPEQMDEQMEMLREQTGKHIQIERPSSTEQKEATEAIRKFRIGGNTMPVTIKPAEGSEFKHEIPAGLDEAGLLDAKNKVLMNHFMALGSIVVTKTSDHLTPAIVYDVERVDHKDKEFLLVKIVRVAKELEDDYEYETLDFDHNEYNVLIEMNMGSGPQPKKIDVGDFSQPVKSREVRARFAVKQLYEDMEL